MTTKATLSAKNVATLRPFIDAFFFPLIKSEFKDLQTTPLKSS